MKKLLVFILILANSGLLACGFYPLGEELRFSFFNPKLFNYYSFQTFNYSVDSFYPELTFPESYVDPNTKLWFEYCQRKVNLHDVNQAVYVIPYSDVHANSTHPMIQYLYKAKDTEAIQYLKFAKLTEYANSLIEDPWERNNSLVTPKRTLSIKKAIQYSKQCKNSQIKNRYLFLALRMAYYNSDFTTINALFTTHIKPQKSKDIVYYWSMYFAALAEKESSLCNYYAAQVFANAIDKRFMVSQQYNKYSSIETTLKHAKTNKEKANVYVLDGIKTVDQSLLNLKKIQQLDPKSEGLSFLLLREINKIEDWVLTPHYTLFESPVKQYWHNESYSIKEVLSRVKSDRVYAQKVLDFVNSVPLNSTENPDVWKFAKVQLCYITQDYNSCLQLINQLKVEIKNNKALYNQLEIIEALVMTANQPKGKAIIPEQVQKVLMNNDTIKKFVFAVGKELEYLGNTSDAALLFSKIGNAGDYSANNSVYWKTIKSNQNYWAGYYDNYFDYMNIMYQPDQVQRLINDIKINSSSTSDFNKWKYSIVKNEMSRLYDLLGTMYIRQNKLQSALKSFKSVTKLYWSSNYSAWEKGTNGQYWNGSNIFDKNPFFTLKYTPDFINQKDQFQLNKCTVTQYLIDYLKKANNPNEKNRDYYYFLVANCYLNMTQEGNSWMMRRFYWTTTGSDSPLEDRNEFNECNWAKNYYLKAFKNSKTKQFKALCLRMAGRCEKNRLIFLDGDSYQGDYDKYSEYLLTKNKYYQDLKTNYPEYYEELISSCSSFKNYFNSRR
jgi:hypothetical protein